ncbi:MAG: S41 family peptidase [Prevotellaceae bacterium]|jgi:carboxyl-terminal processing protease|nr:S41 family peptidase [Prevotellaceae bacterium]
MNLNKLKIIFKLLSTTVILFSTTYGCAQRYEGRYDNVDVSLNKYRKLLHIISTCYIDTVNQQQIIDNAIIGTLKTLDPHSYYISKEEYKAMSEPLEGNFEGIGIEFNILKDTLIVVSPLSGGPSEKVGLKSGDRIISVDGKSITNINLTIIKVHSLLRGPKGSTIRVTVKRGTSVMDFDIVRDRIPINSLDAAYEIKPGMAYLKLSRFAKNSMDEIEEAFAKFENPKSLILDLRGNGGGFMNIASALADQFFGEGKLLVYTESRAFPVQKEISTSYGNFKTGNLTVLIDEASASASEIVSGAIQDQDRGIIIGRRSFGKGLVQSEFPMGDGSAIRLTIARYLTPSGRAIQSPYEKGKAEQYYKNLSNRMSAEAFSADSIVFPDSLKYNTLVNKRVVYGGGGIMPDIYVPLDTSMYSKYIGELNRKNIIFQFISTYIDKNRKSLQGKYKTFTTFKQSFTVTDNLFDEMVAYGEKEGLPADKEGIKISGNYIKQYMKALIARHLFDYSAYFRIMNEGDRTYEKAIEVLDNWDRYRKECLKEE